MKWPLSYDRETLMLMSRFYNYRDVTLSSEPTTVHGPFLIARQVDLKVPIKLEYDLPHFEHGYILANTATRTIAKLSYRNLAQLKVNTRWTYRKQISFHLFYSFLVAFNPSLWTECVYILAKNVLVAMQDP